jgi:hypothetical protein
VLEEEQTADSKHVSAEVHPERLNDRRDIQRAINLWQKHVSEDGGPPLVATFDFSSMQGDWGHRFLICSEPSTNSAAFVIYGLKFAQLLDLPEKVTISVPVIHQLPERYRPVFAEGCTKAMTQQTPARLSGSFDYDFKAELYRAVFLPIMLHPNWSKRLIFGSFNFKTVLSVDQKAL